MSVGVAVLDFVRVLAVAQAIVSYHGRLEFLRRTALGGHLCLRSLLRFFKTPGFLWYPLRDFFIKSASAFIHVVSAIRSIFWLDG